MKNKSLIICLILLSTFIPTTVGAQNKTVGTAQNPKSFAISDAIEGAIIGGAIGFGASMAAVLIPPYYNRPIISIIPKTVEINYSPARMVIHTRILVQNSGKTAAQNCKAYLEYDKDEIKLSWLNPLTDSTVTINAYDSEYLTVCEFDTDQNKISAPIHIGIMNAFYTVGKEKHSVNAQIRVSVANAKGDSKCIIIRAVPDNQGRIVSFKSPD